MALTTNSNAYQQDNCDSILDDIISDFIQEEDEEIVVKVETNLEFEFEDVEEFSDPLVADSEPPKKKLCYEMLSKGMRGNVHKQLITKTYKLQCTECRQLFKNNWAKITLHECSPQEEEETPPPPNTIILQAYRCNKCKKHFISKNAHSVHYNNCADIVSKITANNNRGLPQCSKCKKFFVNDSVMTSHLADCKGCDKKKIYSKFECALCHSIKLNKKSLSDHLLEHNAELLFQQRSALNAPTLHDSTASKIMHPMIISKLNPSLFYCKKCGVGFGYIIALKRHLRTCNPDQYKELCGVMPGPKAKKVWEHLEAQAHQIEML